MGTFAVIPLDDAEGPFFSPREKAFPGAPAELWAEADRRDPDAVRGPDGTAYFPTARYAVKGADVEWAVQPTLDWLLPPLGDRLSLVDGDVDLRPGVRLLHTPGHTPGHQCVLVDTG